MLTSLVTHNSFGYKLYTKEIANTKCQLHHLHLERHFNQQNHDQNIRHLCKNYCFYT